MFIGNLLGLSLVAYHDFATARIGGLFPSSESAYFAGPALLTPFPVEVELAFTRHEQGGSSQLTWRQSSRPGVFAPKVKLHQEEVRFSNGDVILAGTLFMPPTQGPHPAVVLIHGCGQQTRHMVRLHADYFARHGIAALAYDKRGVGASTGDWTDSFDDLAEDALAGVQFMQHHPHIKPDQIGLCGGSQGGWIAPLAASRSKHVAFIILVAGPAVTIAQQNVHNVAYTMWADGFSEDDIRAAVAHIDVWTDVVRTGEGWERLRRSVQKAREEAWSAYAWSLERPPSPEDARLARAEMDRDPVPILRQVSCPVLALFGASDTVVPVQENMKLMENALRNGGHKDYTIRVLPKASHIFLKSETGASRAFPRTTRWVPDYLQIIVEWIWFRG